MVLSSGERRGSWCHFYASTQHSRSDPSPVVVVLIGSRQTGTPAPAPRERNWESKAAKRSGSLFGGETVIWVYALGPTWLVPNLAGGWGVLAAKTVSPKWQRGEGVVEVEVTPEGEEADGAFGANPPGALPERPDYRAERQR